MKAIVCENFAPLNELTFKDVEDPSPSDNEVVVDIKAAGVNYPDALLVQGLYQDRPGLPFIPGVEFAGEVSALGQKVQHLSIGSRVLGISPNYGAYAEKISIPAAMLMPIPQSMPYTAAANLVCAFGTAQHALKQRANLQENESLLVLGAAGGTGIAAVQIGKAMGAHVIAACSSYEKLEIAKQNGADELINYKEQDLKTSVKTLTNGKGVNVVYDPVGGEAFTAASRCMARYGRLLVIGFASGSIPDLPLNLPLVKEYSVTGVFWGSFTRHEPQLFADNMKELFQWYTDDKVRVITDSEIPLAQATNALERMINRDVKGKLVLIP